MIKPVIAVLCLLPLGACAHPNPAVASIVATAIADAKLICNYVPQAEAIGQVVAAGDPLLATGAQIATAFCNAIQAKAASGKLARPLSGSVTIDGINVPYSAK